MPLTSAVRSIDTAGTGAQTAFAFSFRFDSATHVRVSKLLLASPYTETVLSEGTGATNYAITAPATNGGTVTLVTALPDTYELRIQRIVPLTQDTDFAAQGSFAAATHARAFDYAMMAIQQVNDAAIVADEVISGQINTASNVNTAGVGVYKQKTGNDLEFRGIKAADGKITATLDAATNEIRIGVGTGIALASVTDAASAAGLAADVANLVTTNANVAALVTKLPSHGRYVWNAGTNIWDGAQIVGNLPVATTRTAAGRCMITFPVALGSAQFGVAVTRATSSGAGGYTPAVIKTFANVEVWLYEGAALADDVDFEISIFPNLS